MLSTFQGSHHFVLQLTHVGGCRLISNSNTHTYIHRHTHAYVLYIYMGRHLYTHIHKPHIYMKASKHSVFFDLADFVGSGHETPKPHAYPATVFMNSLLRRSYISLQRCHLWAGVRGGSGSGRWLVSLFKYGRVGRVLGRDGEQQRGRASGTLRRTQFHTGGHVLWDMCHRGKRVNSGFSSTPAWAKRNGRPLSLEKVKAMELSCLNKDLIVSGLPSVFYIALSSINKS